MAKTNQRKIFITPQECLEQLPEIPLDFSEKDAADDIYRVELRSSVLNITGLNHVTETTMVRSVVKNALGRLPEFEE